MRPTEKRNKACSADSEKPQESYEGGKNPVPNEEAIHPKENEKNKKGQEKQIHIQTQHE